MVDAPGIITKLHYIHSYQRVIRLKSYYELQTLPAALNNLLFHRVKLKEYIITGHREIVWRDKVR